MNSNFHPIRAAFTLIELMVSIFLMLIIMVGVNSVFKTTSDTVGAGQAQSLMMRDSRAMQATIGRDFSSMASDGPAIIIRDEQLFAYRNQQDYLTDPTNTVPSSADPTNSGTEGTVKATDYGTRSHRLDRIAFFTRQLLHRQTGNDGTFIANESSQEQWIWYGHLRLPDNTSNPTAANFLNPGDTVTASKLPSENPNNFYANQWMLGREAMLLTQPDPTTLAINDINGNSQAYIQRSAAATVTDLAPLSSGSQSKNSPTAFNLETSRFDLAGTSITNFAQILTACLNNTPTYSFWVDMMGGPASRFQAMPYLNRPIASADVARTSPIMRVGVSQFTVEFAGDFVFQTDDNSPTTGTITDCYFSSTSPYPLKPSGQDGKIDFVVTGAALGNPVKSIRWYGLPRATGAVSTKINAANGDVCPLRDTIQSIGGAYASLNAPIEKTGGSGGNNILSSSVPAGATGYLAAMAGLSGYFYEPAWGPSDTVRPKLYRITMTLEDPTGHLPNGQTFEYVFAAP